MQFFNKICAFIWGKCTQILQGLVRNIDKYKDHAKAYNILWLLGEPKKLMSGIDMKMNIQEIMHNAMITFLKMRQGGTESNDDFMKLFNGNV